MEDHKLDERAAAKVAKFEGRMAVVARDNPDLAQACRSVHHQLSLGKAVAESVFNDDVADNPEVVMSIMAAIADELEDIRAEKEGRDDEEDEEG